MELRQIALEVARILQDAGKHALNDQMNPHDMRKLEVSEDCFHFTSDTDKRLQQFISNRLTYVNVFDGFWQLRPEQCYPGQRYWCVGGIDGVINFARSMPEWAITVTLFEFNDQCSAQPILSIVHAPALGLTYLAVRGSGAIRIRKTPLRQTRENHSFHHVVPRWFGGEFRHVSGIVRIAACARCGGEDCRTSCRY